MAATGDRQEAGSFRLAGRRVWVAGHRGMVGSALQRRLQAEGCDILTVERRMLDLRRQAEVEDWMAAERPEAVFLAAAKVGGILANQTWPADFIYDNLVIEANIIEAARRIGVDKLLFLGSSCIYPKSAEQPMKEEAMLSSPLEPTNEWYAVAKIAGIKLCQAYRLQHGLDFISAMPCNLYGIGDNFDRDKSHVVAALLRKMHEAKISGGDKVEIWGSGRPRREFLYVDDCADALVYLMKHYSGDCHINVGCGKDLSIRQLAAASARVVGFGGEFVMDPSKPDGTPRKLLDVTRLNDLGWQAKIDLEEGLHRTYAWYRDSLDGAGSILVHASD